MDKCVFCSLGSEKDAKRVFSDEYCFVVLDKYPADYGHMLVISNAHFGNMLLADEKLVEHMYAVARKMAARTVDKLNAGGVNVVTNIGRQAGQIVDHFHVHVIPRYSGGPLMNGHKEIEKPMIDELVKKLKA